MSGRTSSAVSSASSDVKSGVIDESTLSLAVVTLASSSETLSSWVSTRRPSATTDCQRSSVVSAPVSMLRGEIWRAPSASRFRARSVLCVRICVACSIALSYFAICVVRTLASKTSDGLTALSASSCRCSVKKLLSNDTVRGDLTVRAATSPTWMLNWRGKIGKRAISSSAASAVPNAMVVRREMGRGFPRWSMVYLHAHDIRGRAYLGRRECAGFNASPRLSGVALRGTHRAPAQQATAA